MRNLFLIILITLGSVLVNAQNLVLPLYGKAEFEKIASLDDEMPELHVYLTDKPSSQAVVVWIQGTLFRLGGSLCGKMAKSERHCSLCRQIQDASGKARGACRRFDKGF